MKKGLLVLVSISLLLISCVKLGSAVPAGKASEVTGMAQSPGGLQSLPGGQSGSAPLSQSGSTSSQPSSSGSNMGELQGLQGGNQTSGMGALQPSGAGSAPPSGMAGLKGEDQSVPALAQSGSDPTKNTDDKPYFEVGGDLHADSDLVNVREGVFLSWKVVNAKTLSLDDGNGRISSMPLNVPGTFVPFEYPGRYIYTLTAQNDSGSVSQKVEVLAVTRGQRTAIDKNYRCRTFIVYPQKIKKGESCFVYWNTLDANTVVLQTNLTSNLVDKPELRDLVQPFGVMEFWPPEDTLFRLTFGNGPCPAYRDISDADYSYKDCWVEVR